MPPLRVMIRISSGVFTSRASTVAGLASVIWMPAPVSAMNP